MADILSGLMAEESKSAGIWTCDICGHPRLIHRNVDGLQHVGMVDAIVDISFTPSTMTNDSQCCESEKTIKERYKYSIYIKQAAKEQIENQRLKTSRCNIFLQRNLINRWGRQN
ncbi:MAG TPA: hypothetical protein VEM40_01340 [Nitrospirota bacterium]|nr:hypothetical protein [Nitrospirota bacterium]